MYFARVRGICEQPWLQRFEGGNGDESAEASV